MSISRRFLLETQKSRRGGPRGNPRDVNTITLHKYQLLSHGQLFYYIDIIILTDLERRRFYTVQ